MFTPMIAFFIVVAFLAGIVIGLFMVFTVMRTVERQYNEKEEKPYIHRFKPEFHSN